MVEAGIVCPPRARLSPSVTGLSPSEHLISTTADAVDQGSRPRALPRSYIASEAPAMPISQSYGTPKPLLASHAIRVVSTRPSRCRPGCLPPAWRTGATSGFCSGSICFAQATASACLSKRSMARFVGRFQLNESGKLDNADADVRRTKMQCADIADGLDRRC